MVEVGKFVHDEVSYKSLVFKETIVYSPDERRYIHQRPHLWILIIDLRNTDVRIDDEKTKS